MADPPVAPRGSVLVVDDDPELRALFRALLQPAGYSVLEAEGPAAAQQLLEDGEDVVDAVLLDVMMPQGDGITFLRTLKPARPHVSIVVVTASPDVQHAVTAMKAGASDYLPKPVQKAELLDVTARAVHAAHAARELAVRRALEPPRLGDGQAVFASAAMQQVLGMVEHVKDSSVPVLLQGESGTGKEVLARYIHRRGNRRDLPFVAVNCAALPRDLAESELFGHEKGAFTGAAARRRGRFEEAGDGILFLDEVGELSPDVQSKLLRVLQEREVTRVGGNTVKTGARVLVATNRDLLEEVRAGRFRLDLYYRLEVITLTLPPLRERLDGIAALADHLLQRFAATEGAPPRALAPDALDALRQQDWPGNVRELENLLKRSVLLCAHPLLHAEHLAFSRPRPSLPPAPEPAPAAPPDAAPGVRKLSEYEPDLMMRALAETRGNVAEAARKLGIGRATFYRRAKRYGLPL